VNLYASLALAASGSLLVLLVAAPKHIAEKGYDRGVEGEQVLDRGAAVRQNMAELEIKAKVYGCKHGAGAPDVGIRESAAANPRTSSRRELHPLRMP